MYKIKFSCNRHNNFDGKSIKECIEAMRLYSIGNTTKAKIVTKYLSKGPKTSLEFIFTEKISAKQFKRFIRKMKENGFKSSFDVLFFNTYDNELIYRANMEGSYFCDFSRPNERKVEEVLIWERQHKETTVDKLETRRLKRLLGEVMHLLEKADISSTKDDKDEDWNSLNSYELI